MVPVNRRTVALGVGILFRTRTQTTDTQRTLGANGLFAQKCGLVS